MSFAAKKAYFPTKFSCFSRMRTSHFFANLFGSISLGPFFPLPLFLISCLVAQFIDFLLHGIVALDKGQI